MQFYGVYIKLHSSDDGARPHTKQHNATRRNLTTNSASSSSSSATVTALSTDQCIRGTSGVRTLSAPCSHHSTRRVVRPAVGGGLYSCVVLTSPVIYVRPADNPALRYTSPSLPPFHSLATTLQGMSNVTASQHCCTEAQTTPNYTFLSRHVAFNSAIHQYAAIRWLLSLDSGGAVW